MEQNFPLTCSALSDNRKYFVEGLVTLYFLARGVCVLLRYNLVITLQIERECCGIGMAARGYGACVFCHRLFAVKSTCRVSVIERSILK